MKWCDSCCSWIGNGELMHSCYDARKAGMTEEMIAKRKREMKAKYDFIEEEP